MSIFSVKTKYFLIGFYINCIYLQLHNLNRLFIYKLGFNRGATARPKFLGYDIPSQIQGT
jgi:hypothetical protein